PPHLEALPDGTPAPLRRLIARCLEKDPRQRLQAIGEARILLSGPMAADEAAIAPMPAAARRKSAIFAWCAAALCALGLAALAWVYFRERPPPAAVVRFQIPVPADTRVAGSVRVSPDGRRVAFRNITRRNQIWVRSLDELEARELAGTDGADGDIFWSPDSG